MSASSGVMQALVRKQLRDALRDRWLLGYAGVLALLGLAAGWAGVQGTGGMALQTYGRTAATLTNLCLMLAPLVALLLGASAVAGERDRGTLEHLLAQPLEPGQLLLAKYTGLLLALWGATAVGFAPAALLVAVHGGPTTLLHYLLYPGIASLLIAAMLGLGLWLSVISASGIQAQARAIFMWFAFVLLYDLLLLGTLYSAHLGAGPLAAALLLNPVDAARVLVVLTLEADLHLLGPAGALLVGSLGIGGSAAVLASALLAWAALPLALALLCFRDVETRGVVAALRAAVASARRGPARRQRAGRRGARKTDPPPCTDAPTTWDRPAALRPPGPATMEET